MLARLLVVAAKERVPYDEAGLEAVVFTADGDMRQALNNLQATAAGFGHVSSANVFKVCDQPHPLVVRGMLEACRAGRFEDAHDALSGLCDMGYSATDIITTVFRVREGFFGGGGGGGGLLVQESGGAARAGRQPQQRNTPPLSTHHTRTLTHTHKKPKIKTNSQPKQGRAQRVRARGVPAARVSARGRLLPHAHRRRRQQPAAAERPAGQAVQADDDGGGAGTGGAAGSVSACACVRAHSSTFFACVF